MPVDSPPRARNMRKNQFQKKEYLKEDIYRLSGLQNASLFIAEINYAFTNIKFSSSFLPNDKYLGNYLPNDIFPSYSLRPGIFNNRFDNNY